MSELEEGYRYLLGNLTRDWETREAKIKGSPKELHTTSLAYQPTKDDEAVFVKLTAWPDGDNADPARGRTYASESGKGTRVIVRGTVKQTSWVGNDGEQKTGWEMSVWDCATVIRPPFKDSGSGGQQQSKPKPPAQQKWDPDEEPF